MIVALTKTNMLEEAQPAQPQEAFDVRKAFTDALENQGGDDGEEGTGKAGKDGKGKKSKRKQVKNAVEEALKQEAAAKEERGEQTNSKTSSSSVGFAAHKQATPTEDFLRTQQYTRGNCLAAGPIEDYDIWEKFFLVKQLPKTLP